MKTLGDHPMLVGQILARAQQREIRQFRRRNIRRRIYLTIIEGLSTSFVAILVLSALAAIAAALLFDAR